MSASLFETPQVLVAGAECQGDSEIMTIDPRKLRVPVAAFSMALIVVVYVRSSIQQARFESRTRQSKELLDKTQNLKKT